LAFSSIGPTTHFFGNSVIHAHQLRIPSNFPGTVISFAKGRKNACTQRLKSERDYPKSGIVIFLSKREIEIVALYIRLGKWKAVARSLCISIGTVKTHQRAAMRKIGASNSVELVTLAIRRGLVDLNSIEERTNEQD
jgi:DNA-binding NarL/FixJ family response regulator